MIAAQRPPKTHMSPTKEVLPRAPNARRGILWMIAATILFADVNATAKYLVQFYEVSQVAWAYFALFCPVLFVLLVLLNVRLLRSMATRRPGLQMVRALCLIAAVAFFFTTVQIFPLAEASAVLYTAPIFVCALSVPLLGERVGLRRWIGVMAGFAGALVVIRPGTGTVQAEALLPFGAAVSFALYQIVTRRLSRTDGTMTTLVNTTVYCAVLSSMVVPFFWTTPNLTDWVLMVNLGVAGGVGQFALIRAYEAAPAATIAPFNYAGLIWATLLGFALFSQFPDLWSVLGALAIIASGIYIFRIEARRPEGASETPPSQKEK